MKNASENRQTFTAILTGTLLAGFTIQKLMVVVRAEVEQEVRRLEEETIFHVDALPVFHPGDEDRSFEKRFHPDGKHLVVIASAPLGSVKLFGPFMDDDDADDFADSFTDDSGATRVVTLPE